MRASHIVEVALASSLVLVLLGCGRIGFPSVSEDALALDPCQGVSLSCDGAMHCHDFESGTLDEWGWRCDGDDYRCSPAIPEAELDVVSSQACNGDSVFRAYTEGGPDTKQNAYVGQYIDSDDFFVRFVMRWPEGTNIRHRGVFIALPSERGDSPRFGFGREDGEMRMTLHGEHYYFSGSVPADEWTCVELHITANRAEVWLGGVSAFAFDGPTIEDSHSFESVTLGITGSSSEGPTEILFDDYAISTERIGCR